MSEFKGFEMNTKAQDRIWDCLKIAVQNAIKDSYKQGQQDATKEIREVWEKYKDDELRTGELHSMDYFIGTRLWEAIKACGKRAGWIEGKE